jgi:ADP-ribosylglycohydrolase
MLGAIAGDIIGSLYEIQGLKTMDFPLFVPKSHFTDDTVLTVAVADGLLHPEKTYTDCYYEYGNRYPMAGYGKTFRNWLQSADKQPYNSWGNGSAMRVSPVAYAFETLEEVVAEAEKTAIATHNHPEGIKGAQAVSTAIFLARKGKTKPEIKDAIQRMFQYDLERTIDQIQPDYKFDVSCQGSVPESVIAFLEGNDFEETVRLAVSLGGDADTMACIAGSIAEAFYGGIPAGIEAETRRRLPAAMLQVVEAFYRKYPPQNSQHT